MLITYLLAIFIYSQLAHSSSIDPQTASVHPLQPRDTHNADVLSKSVFLHKRANQVQEYVPDIIGGETDGDGWGAEPDKPRSKRSIHKDIITEDPGQPAGWARYRVKREYKPNMIVGDDGDHHWRRIRVKRAINTNTNSGSA